MITIGIDPHSRTHSAAALDEGGRVLAEITVGSDGRELDRLVRWIQSVGPERIVAVEGARGFGLALCRKLLAAGEIVFDVAPALTRRNAVRAAGRARTTGEMPLRWRASRSASRTSRARRPR